MADLVEVAIESALLNELVARTTSPSILLSLPNIAFTPPSPVTSSTKWLRATFLPADSFALGLSHSSTNQHHGIFQVDVFWGQGSGELAPGRLAADVMTWFRRGTELTKDGFVVSVVKQPYRSRMVKDDPWVMIPVSVPYLAFATPS